MDKMLRFEASLTGRRQSCNVARTQTLMRPLTQRDMTPGCQEIFNQFIQDMVQPAYDYFKKTFLEDRKDLLLKYDLAQLAHPKLLHEYRANDYDKAKFVTA